MTAGKTRSLIAPLRRIGLLLSAARVVYPRSTRHAAKHRDLRPRRLRPTEALRMASNRARDRSRDSTNRAPRLPAHGRALGEQRAGDRWARSLPECRRRPWRRPACRTPALPTRRWARPRATKPAPARRLRCSRQRELVLRDAAEEAHTVGRRPVAPPTPQALWHAGRRRRCAGETPAARPAPGSPGAAPCSRAGCPRRSASAHRASPACCAPAACGSGAKARQIDAVAQHADAIGRHAERAHAIGQRATRPRSKRLPPATPSASTRAAPRYCAMQVDVTAARGDRQRLIESARQQRGGNAVGIVVMRVDQIEIEALAPSGDATPALRQAPSPAARCSCRLSAGAHSADAAHRCRCASRVPAFARYECVVAEARCRRRKPRHRRDDSRFDRVLRQHFAQARIDKGGVCRPHAARVERREQQHARTSGRRLHHRGPVVHLRVTPPRAASARIGPRSRR